MPQGIDKFAHRGNGGSLKDGAQRQLDIEGAPDAGDQPGGQERVAPALKEVVVNAELVAFEQLAPDLGEGLLGWECPERHSSGARCPEDLRAAGAPGDRSCRWRVRGIFSRMRMAWGTM